ncbi:hypothetical protein D3C84_749650 [compost metagenome]
MVRFIGRNDAAVRAEQGGLKQAEVLAGIVDAGCHKNGRTPVVVQTRLQAEVLDDAGDNAMFALAGTHQRFQGCPALAQDRLLIVVQASSFLLEPSIDGLF